MPKKNKDGIEETAFNLALPHDQWVFLKYQAAIQGRPMKQIISELVKRYQNKIKNKLTDPGA